MPDLIIPKSVALTVAAYLFQPALRLSLITWLARYQCV